MKKILAILLVGVMSVTAFGFNASAVEKTDAEIQQEKLGYILNLNKDIWLDCAVIYDGVWPSIWTTQEKCMILTVYRQMNILLH